MVTKKIESIATGFDLSRAIRKLRTRHLELLQRLGTERSVRAASSQMALTQPALSKMLRELEDSFGTQLFERSHSGVVPTLAGRHLIAYATSFLNSLSAIGNDVERIALGQAASLRLGTFSVMPCVPRAIARMTNADPNVSIQVKEAHGVVLLAALAAGEIDCIVAALPPEILQKSDVKSLRVELLYEDELCVVASPKHRLARARALQWAQLDGCRWALPPQDSLLRRAVIDMHMRAGIMPPTPVAEMMSPILLSELLMLDRSLLGVMRLEQSSLEQHNGRVRRLRLAQQVPLPPMSLITSRQEGPRDSLISTFLQALRSEIRTGI